MHKSLTPFRTRGIGMLVAVAAFCGVIAPAFARADTVTDWNGYASSTTSNQSTKGS